jgi:hypothetical protein
VSNLALYAVSSTGTAKGEGGRGGDSLFLNGSTRRWFNRESLPVGSDVWNMVM